MFYLTALVSVLLFGSAFSQFDNCNYQQDMTLNVTYYVYNIEYPNKYAAGTQCRWRANCPQNYNIRLDCQVDLPYTNGCTLDRLLISRTGDQSFDAAERYCGQGNLTAIVSIKQSISIALMASKNSPGGKILCTLKAQKAQPVCSCGYKKTNRIVGGNVTGVNEFPMMAYLADRRTFELQCGGVIISPRSILTAGHCLYKQNASDYAVVVGDHDISTGLDTGAVQAFAVEEWLIHPNFVLATYDYDVGIVKVLGTIIFSDSVGPVCLPFKFVNDDFTGATVTALGWGTTAPGEPTSNKLLKVDLQVISQTSCQSQLSGVTARQMCTYTRGKDACQHDSGGPLLYTDPNTRLLYNPGVISAGQFCASSKPSINTRVTSILSWIQKSAPYDYCQK